MPAQSSPRMDSAVQLVLDRTHDAKDAAESVGLPAKAVQHIRKRVREERQRQEDDALAARALFMTQKKAKKARTASRAPATKEKPAFNFRHTGHQVGVINKAKHTWRRTTRRSMAQHAQMRMSSRSKRSTWRSWRCSHGAGLPLPRPLAPPHARPSLRRRRLQRSANRDFLIHGGFVARIIGSLVSQPFRAPCGAMAEWHRRACFRTRRGGRGEHCEPCAATSDAPTAVNALNTDNRVCACIHETKPSFGGRCRRRQLTARNPA